MKSTFLAAFAALSFVASTTSACKSCCDPKHACACTHVAVQTPGCEPIAVAQGTAQAPCAVAQPACPQVAAPSAPAVVCAPAVACVPVAGVHAVHPRVPVTVRVQAPAYVVTTPVIAPMRVRARVPAAGTPCPPTPECAPARPGAHGHGQSECAPSAPHGVTGSSCQAGKSSGLSSANATGLDSPVAVLGTPSPLTAVSLPSVVCTQGVGTAQAGATTDSPRVRSLLTRVRETNPEGVGARADTLELREVPPAGAAVTIPEPSIDVPPCTDAPDEEDPCSDADDEDEDEDEGEGEAMVLDFQSDFAPLMTTRLDLDPQVFALGELYGADGGLSEEFTQELAEVGREAEEAAREAYQEAMEAWQGQQGNWKELQETLRAQQGEWREKQEAMRKDIEERVREATQRAQEVQKEYAERVHAQTKELQERLRAHAVETQKRSKDLADKLRAKVQRKHEQQRGQAPDGSKEKADKELRARIERMEQHARARHPEMEDADGERSLEERVELLERLLAEERAAGPLGPTPKVPRTAPKLRRPSGNAPGSKGPMGAGPAGAGPSGPGHLRALQGLPGVQWKYLTELGKLAEVAPHAARVYTVDEKGKLKAMTAPQGMTPDGQPWTFRSDDRAGHGEKAAAQADLQNEIEKRMNELRAQMGELRERLQELRTEIGRSPLRADGAR